MQEKRKIYSPELCDAYFGGLLPEGDLAHKAIGNQFGINHHNVFSLLKEIGHDCAGAVSVVEIDEPISKESIFPIKGRILSEKELAQHI